jgi:DNA-binding LacI/PurR family transcriptional regulator
MVRSTDPSSVRERVAVYRARLREQGLRPIQIWVPDVNSPEFKSEARRQSQLVAQSPHAEDDQAFVDAVTDWDYE